MRYVRLRVWITFVLVVAGVIFLLKYSTGGPGIYTSSQPIDDSLLTSAYPDLYEAITNRDAQQLKPFLSHEHQEVRNQAWRALANTPVDTISEFIDLAVEQNSEVAWFGISNHDLSTELLRELENSWINNPDLGGGIVRVLGRQGDEKTLSFLLDELDGEIQNQYHFALAIGRLVQKFNIGQSDQIKIIQNAFDAEDYETTRAYLYGWYRGDESELTEVASDTLFDRWQLQGAGLSRIVDQFVNKILPERTTATMAVYYNGEQELNDHIQLVYELATSIKKIPLNDRNSLAAKFLLTNANPHVQVRTLKSLTGRIEKGDDLFRYISGEMLTEDVIADVVWLQVIQTLIEVEPEIASEHMDELEAIPQRNPYLWPQTLDIYRQLESPDEHLERIQEMVASEDTLRTMAAVQNINEFWQQLVPDEKTKERADQVRNVVFGALEMGDRGIAFMAQPVLKNAELFDAADFDRINKSLTAFSLPGDIEVYQAFGSLYKERFEQQARAVIDSLAALDHAPLNRSLSEAGWDVPVPKESEIDFLSLDWERIWELGRKPVLTLRTQKGFIEMQLNTLTAPATVAMVDSLNRAGKYEKVPFHRVLPNFVIQGGDFERKDGFGGPSFVIPTEPSEQGFNRGAVGMASAGTDTEGSQYFIMHQWKPHLNGSYTRFGRVISGMNVVDTIVEGDSVLTTSWY